MKKNIHVVLVLQCFTKFHQGKNFEFLRGYIQTLKDFTILHMRDTGCNLQAQQNSTTACVFFVGNNF